MGIAVLGSRRSGTSLMQNIVIDIVLQGKVAPKVRYVLEPYYWQTEIEHPGARNIVPHERSKKHWDYHLNTPYFIKTPGYKDEFINRTLTHRDGLYPVVKYTLALGRCLPILEHPETKVVYIVRDPREVLASVNGLVFDLGEVNVNHGKDWKAASDWHHFFPDLPYKDRILRNAMRWERENSLAFATLSTRERAFLLTFDELETRPREIVTALAEFMGADLSEESLTSISTIRPRESKKELPPEHLHKADGVFPLYELIAQSTYLALHPPT